ncbi:MAG: hypothetical protein BHV58_02410 [Bifidobacteriales bacterium 56_10]|nr:MAG: hypothetical protein BHV58_02410 [Bifidobacteriales bacterium 56_10]
MVDNAPKQTSVEHALEENARMLKEQQGMHFDFDRKHPPTPKKPVHTMPNGQQMVAFGDSVMLASSKGLQSVFPGITVDAETSRSMTKQSQKPAGRIAPMGAGRLGYEFSGDRWPTQ